MTMSENTLALLLEGLTPTDDEAEAREALADAYASYAGDASAGEVDMPEVSEETGRAAMAAALVGMSAPNAGLSVIPSAVVAFWAAAVAPPWPPSVAATPPPNATLAATFASTCAALTDASATLEEAAEAIAATMHAEAIEGGEMLIPPPATGTATAIE